MINLVFYYVFTRFIYYVFYYAYYYVFTMFITTFSQRLSLQVCAKGAHKQMWTMDKVKGGEAAGGLACCFVVVPIGIQSSPEI